MRRWVLSAVLGIAASSFAGAYSIPANATAVTIGDNYQESSNRESKSIPTAAQCTDIAYCHLLFNIIPAGKQLLVTDVSCFFQLYGDNANNVFRAKLETYAAGGLTDRATFLAPVVTKSLAPDNIFYTANGTTRHLFKAGDRPIITLHANEAGDFNVVCTIMGKIGNPPD